MRLESVRARKGEAREALLVLSILFSLGVALIAALNARYLATRGQGFLNLETDPLELGGFSSGDLQVVTTLESLLFAAILVGVAGPALLHIEKQGGELLDDLCSDESSVSEPATEDGDLAPQAVDALITRDESGAKLGLTTRPVQWMESTFALVLPILTGISADFLGLLG